MAVSLNPASVDSGLTSNLLDWAAAGPHRPAARRLADQALSEQVIRYARCADSNLDPDDWFPGQYGDRQGSPRGGRGHHRLHRLRGTRPVPGAVAAALGCRSIRCLGRPGRRRAYGIAPRAARKPASALHQKMNTLQPRDHRRDHRCPCRAPSGTRIGWLSGPGRSAVSFKNGIDIPFCSGDC
jgi:hypothetical protein